MPTPARFPLCSYEKMSAILKPDNNLSAILRPKCHWWGWRGWWWRLLMSPVLPGNKYVFPVGKFWLLHQRVVTNGPAVVVLLDLPVSLSLFVGVSRTLSDRRQMPLQTEWNYLRSELDLLKVSVMSNKFVELRNVSPRPLPNALLAQRWTLNVVLCKGQFHAALLKTLRRNKLLAGHSLLLQKIKSAALDQGLIRNLYLTV